MGRNYADHAAELGNALPASPMIFIKPSTSVIGPNVAIALPASSERVDYEGELAVVIGRPCRDVRAENAASVILGYTVANDVTARDQQRADVQFTRAKGYDTFCPLGPWIETELDPSDLALHTELDGVTVQDGRTSDMVFTVGEIVEFVSRHHDAAARRRAADRDPRGGRPDAGRAERVGDGGGHRHADQPGGRAPLSAVVGREKSWVALGCARSSRRSMLRCSSLR